jgi:hypothetical protein
MTSGSADVLSDIAPSVILRGADTPTTSVKRQKLKDLLPPSTVMACSGAEQREEPSDQYFVFCHSLALELPMKRLPTVLCSSC